jgi:exopolysaccharide biosynthesis polyprenyl glycosylphosphotransferase
MLRRDRQIRTTIHQLMDACLFAISFWLAYQLRADPRVIALFHLDPVDPFDSYAWLAFFVIPAAALILEAQGFYDRPAICSWRTTAWRLFKGCLWTTLGLVLALFFVKALMPRWVVIWFGGISFVLVFTKEQILGWLARSQLAQAQYRRRFILVGTQEETARMRAEIQKHPQGGIDIVATLNLAEHPVQRLAEMLHEYSANGVILSAKHTYFEQVEAAIRTCELEGIEAWLVADFFQTQISRTVPDDFYGRPVLVFRTTPESSWQMILKQLLDLVGAVALLLIAGPLLLLPVAILIKLTSPGPVLFKQRRSGLNGQPFMIYKFRTMVTNAEQLKEELAAMNEMSGPVFKVGNDPRITRIGRWLRRFSIDELPQLVNVLRLEMSLVGPRPLPVDEVKRFDDLAHRRRLSVKPGLTCLWQISGRNNLRDFREWVRLDLEYIDNWSLWLDLKILARTVPVVLSGVGAK